MSFLPKRTAIVVFLAFAFAYFFSTLIRAITATLSPILTQEFALKASDLGLLAGVYFLGFAALQLPLGTWLDRYGPKQVIFGFMSMAVVGCLAFAWATSFTGLLAARLLCGLGVSACLMAPLTAYRRWFSANLLLRANSWMLMSGSLGMVASTLPVQWLMPLVGWRVLFLGLAGMALFAMVLITWQVPSWALDAAPRDPQVAPQSASYAEVWCHPYFRKMAPMGFFCYGGMIAIQTLWAVPWMTQVAAYSPLQASRGLFWLNVAMLFTFWTWGLVNPWLARRGIDANHLIRYGMPSSFLLLALIVSSGQGSGMWSATLWTVYCMSCTFVALAQPSVAMAFKPALAGRALSAYNLVIFSGVFAVQWGIGLAIEGFRGLGFTEIQGFQAAMGTFLMCSVASYLYFLIAKSHNQTI
jgi:predicted MFS family arabinose efflux permease